MRVPLRLIAPGFALFTLGVLALPAASAATGEKLAFEAYEDDALAVSLAGCNDGCCDACADDGCTECGAGCDLGCCCTIPLWTVGAGAVILERDRPRNAALVSDAGNLDRLVNARDFDFGWQGGVDVWARRRVGCGCNAIEARYFGVDEWSDQLRFNVPANWTLRMRNLDLAITPGAIRSVTIDYDSSLHSAEINWRHQRGCHFDWIAGFRYIELDENLRYAARVSGVDAAINFATDNNLYGGQIGGDLRLLGLSGPAFANIVGKAGIYGNDADGRASITAGNNTLYSASDHIGDVAFVGELDFITGYRLTPHFAIRGGYQLLWIDGVALASEQLEAVDMVAQAGITTNGAPFYHGALIGGEFTW